VLGRIPRSRGRLFADTTPLRTPDFRRLWLTGIVTVIGANLTIFAVPVQLYALTQNSAYVGLSGLFALVPLVVFGLLGGAWADAMDRRLLLIIASCGLAVASVFLWLQAALALNNVWVVLCLLSVQQAFYAVNQPTRSAAIPRMLPGDQLPAANSLNMTVMQFGAIVGPLLAGVMLHWVDLSTLYLIDAITCIAPIWATFRLSPMPPTNGGQGSSGWGFGAVLDGFRYLAGNYVVLMSFIVDLIAMIFGMPRALFPQMAHESFGGPVEGGTTMALLAAAMSAGAVAGGVFSGWLPRIRRQGLAVVIAIVVWGAAMVGFGLAGGLALGALPSHAGGPPGGGGTAGTFLWIALVFLTIGGAADMVSSAFRNTILQQAASDEVRGRLQGVFTVVVAGGPRLADAVHGGAAAVVGTTVAAAGGGALVVVGVVIAALVVPAFIRYRGAEDDKV
jgi:Transmembrane secretion effector